MLFQIIFLKFSLSSLFGLLFGAAIGVGIFTMVYLVYVLRGMNSNKYKLNTDLELIEQITDNKLSKKERKALEKEYLSKNNSKIVANMIEEYQSLFKDKGLRGNKSNITYCKELTISLVYNIAKTYYPNSKRPLYEVSIEEVLKLLKYISIRIGDLFNYQGLKFIRKMNISSIMSLLNLKKSIEGLEIVKVAKRYKINNIINGFKVIINVVNPIYWVRKFIISTSFNLIIKKLCVIIIAMAGEEAYKIYSKSVFNDEEINAEIEALENNTQKGDEMLNEV